MENQRRQAAREAERKAREEAARKAKEDAARRAQQEQQRIAQEAAARQAAEAAAQQAAAQEAAAKAAEEARQKAEQERLAAIEEQRRKDAEEAAKQRQAQAQGITAAAASLNRPASPLRQYSGYTPLDYDVSKTGSLTDQYARMLNVPFFQPFIAQEDINLAPGATAEDSIFGIDSLLPNYTFDPLSQTASNPYFSARQGGRVQKDMGGFIGFMDEPLNIMHPTTKIDVVDGGISSILKKYKEIRSEL
jgi:multidrug efflux pump subunit AcrA (membrane-fusion protein)